MVNSKRLCRRSNDMYSYFLSLPSQAFVRTWDSAVNQKINIELDVYMGLHVEDVVFWFPVMYL